MQAFADNIFVFSHCRRDIGPSYLEVVVVVVVVVPSPFLLCISLMIGHSYSLAMKNQYGERLAAIKCGLLMLLFLMSGGGGRPQRADGGWRMEGEQGKIEWQAPIDRAPHRRCDLMSRSSSEIRSFLDSCAHSSADDDKILDVSAYR